MQASGEFTVRRSPNEVSEFLSDPLRFARCFPDFHQVRVDDAAHFTVALNIAFGLMQGVLDLHLERVDFVSGQRVQYLGKGTAASNDIVFELKFELGPADQQTRVLWSGSFTVQGTLASFAPSIVDELGERNLRQMVANVVTALDPKPA